MVFHTLVSRIKSIVFVSALGLTMASCVAEEADFNPRRVLNRPLPAITNAPFVAAQEADRKLHERELVLGIVVGGKARAYPINMLTGPRREIINDTLGKRAIAATW